MAKKQEEHPEGKEELHFDKEIAIQSSANMPRFETIKFQNNRDPGRPLNFFYASKTHNLKSYTLVHDKEYTLPIEVIDHLEGMNPNDPNSCSQFIYSDQYHPDKDITKSTVTGYKSLYQCKRVRSR